jgi:hypothetical protein
MHLSQLVRIEPHCVAQGLHRDAGYLELNLPRSHGCDTLEYELSTIWALSEFTKESGVRVHTQSTHRDAYNGNTFIHANARV